MDNVRIIFLNKNQIAEQLKAKDATQSIGAYSHLIFDCRFEYEFIGGHVKGAINFPPDPKFIKSIFMNGNQGIFYSKKCIDHIRRTERLTCEMLPKLQEILNNESNRLADSPAILFYCEFSSHRAPNTYILFQKLKIAVNCGDKKTDLFVNIQKQTFQI